MPSRTLDFFCFLATLTFEISFAFFEGTRVVVTGSATMAFQEIMTAAAKAGTTLDAVSVAFALGHLARKRKAQSFDLAFRTLKYTLNDKARHPAIGFGTYKCGVVPASATAGAGKRDIRSAKDIISDAIEVGYRMFDCAQFYDNEADVGEALISTGVDRSELYLISKVWNNTIFEGPEAVRAQVKKTLSDLQTDYLDLYLVHWPVPGHHIAAYLELEKLQKEGLVRSIGVSNYTVEDFNELMAGGATVVPAVNQIEINPFLHREDTIRFFKSKGVQLQAYRSLRAGKQHDNEVLATIAAKHGKSVAQILGAWAVQHGYM